MGTRRPTLLALTGPTRGLVPGGICVPDPVEFAQLAAWLHHASHAADGDDRAPVVDLGSWTAAPPALVSAVDLRISPVHATDVAVATLVGLCADVRRHARTDVMDPEPLRRIAVPLVTAALSDASDLVWSHLTSLVGAGPGSTPTGDDVIVGVLAALDAASGTNLVTARARAARQRIEIPLRALLGATTTASRHDLDAAIRGEVAEHVHAAVRALQDPTLGPAVAAAARGRGATSGIDVLSGLAQASGAVLRHTRSAPTSLTDRAAGAVDSPLRRTA